VTTLARGRPVLDHLIHSRRRQQLTPAPLEPSWGCWRLLALETRTELCLQIMVLEGLRVGGIRLRRSSRR
jgi:hypothetical protein